MDLWCPFAERKTLGPQTEPRIGVPKIFLVHTMVGFLRGTDTMFRRGGYSGTESTFGVGGALDTGLDGAIWQWQDLAHSADANFEANAYATSVETSDGGRPHLPWSDKQAEALVRLGVWWCKTTGNPAELVTSPSGRGFGWHAQFHMWNKTAHACPGPVRLAQYKSDIVPEIAHRLTGNKPPAEPNGFPEWPTRVLSHPPAMRGEDVRTWQQGMRRLGYDLAADGVYGPRSKQACAALQHAVGLPPTGEVDPETWLMTFVSEPEPKEKKP